MTTYPRYKYSLGTYKDGALQGLGKMQFANKKEEYIGNFIDNKKDGFGVGTYNDDVYEGHFENGMMDGFGRY